jgi:hypothetical protein
MQKFIDEDDLADFLNRLFDRQIRVDLLTDKAKIIDTLDLKSKNTIKHIRQLDEIEDSTTVHIIFDSRVAILLLGTQE